MDRIWASIDGAEDRARRSPSDEFALPSRAEAIVTLRPVLEAQVGPVLVTGEAGVGKTWLWRRLRAEMPPSWRWTVVDIPPALDPTALYLLIGHALGLADAVTGAGAADEARLVLADALREASVDGVRWALVFDEAHNGSAALLEEVRILANRLGDPDGFSALLLVGQTSLACRLVARPLKGLAARLAAHVHLRCLDVEESRALLNCLAPTLDWDDRTVERLQCDTGGNPRRMLLAARSETVGSSRRRRVRPADSPLPHDRPRLVPGATATAPPENWEATVIGPVKPPLLLGDGMIEVGWEPDLELEREPNPGKAPAPALEPAASPATAPPPVPSPSPSRITTAGLHGAVAEFELEAAVETLEPIEDHYTALQARDEWSRNQGRHAASAASGDAAPIGPSGDAAAGTNDDAAQAPGGQPSVWIEGQQGFAPYGLLFSRLRQGRDANEPS